jgi:hypothetical protein
MLGLDGGEENADDADVAHSFDDIGAVILGRNMFATSRDPWIDDGGPLLAFALDARDAR